MNATNQISRATESRVLDLDRLVPVMRLGWLAKGVVYAIMGVLAVPIAFGGGGGGESASQTGALAAIAGNPFGQVLLALTAMGLGLYAAWRLTTAFLPGDDTELETWAHRVGYLFSAVVYGFLAWSALSLSMSGGSGSGGSSDESRIEQLSRTLMESTGGRWLLGLGAVAALGVAAYFAYKGVDREFLDDVDLADASSAEREAIEKLGAIGWIGRATTVALVAVFVLAAAWTANPEEARGLDGALRDVAGTWWGSMLVLVAGVGLIAYGVHAAVSARHRRLLGP